MIFSYAYIMPFDYICNQNPFLVNCSSWHTLPLILSSIACLFSCDLWSLVSCSQEYRWGIIYWNNLVPVTRLLKERSLHFLPTITAFKTSGRSKPCWALSWSKTESWWPQSLAGLVLVIISTSSSRMQDYATWWRKGSTNNLLLPLPLIFFLALLHNIPRVM